jgi:hypothetical protein
MRGSARVAADRGVAAGVVDLAVVVAVACSHLVHGKRARLVAGDTSCAAQRLDSLEVLDENIDVFHLDGCEGQSHRELQHDVREMRDRARDNRHTWGSSPSGTLATMMPMAKMRAWGRW